MRAAVHVAPGALRVESRPTPAVGPGELLLRVRGCGLCGSDLAKLREAPTGSAVLGHEVVGEVIAVGVAAGDHVPGERVVVAHHVPCFACHYCRHGSPSMCRTFKASNLDPGGFAEYVRVPPENVRHATFRVPAHLSDAAAAFTEPLACCVRAVRRARVGPDQVVAVVGVGAMGGLLLQLARRVGADVVAVDPVPERRALAERLGAVVASEPARARATLGERTAGRGADVALLTVGASAVVREALDLVRDGGAVHLFVGEGEGPLPIGAMYRRELTLTATYSSSPADLAEAFALIVEGRIEVDPLVSHRLPLDDVQEGARLMERRVALKVFVEIGASAT
jgi:L-iditol 2-dehydrogenase